VPSPTSFPEFPQATATATQTSTESIHQLRLSLLFSLSLSSSLFHINIEQRPHRIRGHPRSSGPDSMPARSNFILPLLPPLLLGSSSKQSRQHEPVRHKSTGVFSTDRHRDHEASPPLTGAHRRPSIRVGGNGAAAGRAPWLDGLSNRRHTWHRQPRQLRTAAHDSGPRLREAAPAAALPVPRARTLWSLC
jgi:hypothetical protein